MYVSRGKEHLHLSRVKSQVTTVKFRRPRSWLGFTMEDSHIHVPQAKRRSARRPSTRRRSSAPRCTRSSTRRPPCQSTPGLRTRKMPPQEYKYFRITTAPGRISWHLLGRPFFMVRYFIALLRAVLRGVNGLFERYLEFHLKIYIGNIVCYFEIKNLRDSEEKLKYCCRIIILSVHIF